MECTIIQLVTLQTRPPAALNSPRLMFPQESQHLPQISCTSVIELLQITTVRGPCVCFAMHSHAGFKMAGAVIAKASEDIVYEDWCCTPDDQAEVC